jgi:hypothetical protein
MIDLRRLDDVLEVGPTEPMSDDDLAAMLADAEARGIVPTPPAALARLLDELRSLPEGVASRVRADLLIADVLAALGRQEAPACETARCGACAACLHQAATRPHFSDTPTDRRELDEHEAAWPCEAGTAQKLMGGRWVRVERGEA